MHTVSHPRKDKVNYTKRIRENQKRRGHELLPQELRGKLPKLYSTDGQGDKAIAKVKFFGANGWTWYATEFDGKNTFFGLVVGDFPELGYFNLTELEEARMPKPKVTPPANYVFTAGYPAVERDLYFKPLSLGEARKRHGIQPL